MGLLRERKLTSQGAFLKGHWSLLWGLVLFFAAGMIHAETNSAKPSDGQSQPQSQARLSYAELTPFEKAIVETFLRKHSRFKSEGSLPEIAREGSFNGVNWMNGVNADSLQRLIRFAPSLGAVVADGRQHRMTVYNSFLNISLPKAIEASGLDPLLSTGIANQYFALLEQYEGKKAAPPAWLEAQAEKMVRQRRAEEFDRISREGIETTKADSGVKEKKQSPATPATQEAEEAKPNAQWQVIPPLPKDRWPKDARQELYDTYERLLRSLPPAKNTADLPPQVLMSWARQARAQVERQRDIVTKEIADLPTVPRTRNFHHPHLNSYWEIYLRSLDKQHGNLLKFLQGKGGEFNDPEARKEFLIQHREEDPKQMEYLKTEQFGPEASRVGGAKNPIKDPSLAWLLDLEWTTGPRTLDELSQSRNKPYQIRLPISWLVDQQHWWREFKGDTVRAAKVYALIVGTAGALFGLANADSDLIKTYENSTIAIRSINEWGNKSPNGLASRNNPVGINEASTEAIFKIVRGQSSKEFPLPSHPQLEMPIQEDLALGHETVPMRLEKGALMLATESPFAAFKGEFVPLPRIFGTHPTIDQVTRNSKALVPEVDYQLIKSKNGFYFIQLKTPDYFPKLSASSIGYRVSYVPDPKEQLNQTPPEPILKSHENSAAARQVKEAGFKPLSEGLERLSSDANQQEVTVSAVNGTIKDLALYSRVPASKRRILFSNNPIHQFSDFNDTHANLCPDCDVANDFLRELISPRVEQREKWTFEVRPCFTTQDGKTYHANGGHGTLFGWKQGYRDPLIWDATPHNQDPRNSMTPEERERDKKNPEKPEGHRPFYPNDPIGPNDLIGPMHHEFRFRGQVDIREGKGGPLPPEPPDLEDPLIRRKVFSAKVAAATEVLISDRKERNKGREAALIELEKGEVALLKVLEKNQVRNGFDSTLPHRTALQLSRSLKGWMESGRDRFEEDAVTLEAQKTHRDQLKQIFSTWQVSFDGTAASLGVALEALHTKLQASIAMRAKLPLRESKSNNALEAPVTTASLGLIQILKNQQWTPLESMLPHHVRHSCYNALVSIREEGIGK